MTFLGTFGSCSWCGKTHRVTAKEWKKSEKTARLICPYCGGLCSCQKRWYGKGKLTVGPASKCKKCNN